LRRAAFLVLAPLVVWAAVVIGQEVEPPLPGEEPVRDAEVVVEGEVPPPDPADEENGFLIGFIQNLLSAPGREVRISGISGVLSSRASIAEISVADADGVWLRIDNVSIDWSRRALFLRRIQVRELTIGEIHHFRPALPPEATGPRLADAEARPFALPELPLALRVEALEVGALRFGEAVLGEAAELTAQGYLTLEGGDLDTDLRVTRTDGPGGEFRVAAAFSNETRILDLDIALSEPPGGLVATALGIEGRPAIDLALQGAGPLEDLDVAFSLDADATRLASGEVALREAQEGLAFTADFEGALAPLVPADYRDFFAGESRVRLAGINLDPGGLRLDEITVAGEALTLAGSLELGPDNFLTGLELEGTIGDPRDPPLTLPVPGGQTRLHSGILFVSYGEGNRWEGRFDLDRLLLGDIEIEDLTLEMGGLAENLDDPARRNVTIHVEGIATGLWAEDPSVRLALGDRIDFFADAAVPPDAPVRIRQLQIAGGGLSIFTAGTLEDLVYSGRHAVRIADLAPFAGLAERTLAGGIDIRATGDVLLASGGFELALDGTAEDLGIGEPQIDPLLAGITTLSGRISRDEEGLRTDAFTIANEQISLTSTGIVSGDETDIGFEARLADLALVVPEASGSVTARGTAIGAEGAVFVSLEAGVPQGSLLGQQVTGLTAGFDGNVLNGDITGALRGTGALNGSQVALEGDLALAGESRSLSDLVFAVGANRITGTVVQRGEAPIEGNLAVAAPNLSKLAALALVEAEGAANARLRLGPARVGQGLAITADIRDLAVAGNRVAAVELEAEVEDAFGVPLVEGSLSAEDIVAGGLELVRLTAEAAQTEADRMAFSAETLFAWGTEASLSGSLERLEDGFALTLAALDLDQDGLTARLAAPATVTIRDDLVALSPLALDLGEGRLEVEGTVADDALNIDVTLTQVTLSLANTIQPDLAAGGIVDGTASVTGPTDAPAIAFDLTALGVTAAPLAELGLPPLSLAATGATEAGLLALDTRLTSPDGLDARAAGTLPIGDRETGPIDLAIDITALPLALVDTLLGQGLQGTLAGSARATGTLAAPEVAFDVTATDASVATTREAGLPGFQVEATGETVDGRLALDTLLTGPGGIAARATGSVPLDAGLLDLAIDVDALPLSTLDAAAGNPGLQGTLAGTAQVTGTTAAPEAAFSASVSGFSIEALRENLVPPLSVTATGTFADATITLAQATVSGPGNITLTGGGAIPLTGPGLNLAVSGGVPLGLADATLADRPAQLGGRAEFNIAITGALADPQFSGPVSIAGATFVDAPTNLRLEGISLDAVLQGRTMIVNAFSARSAQGGTISGAGSVGLDPDAGFPLDLQVAFARFGYTDGALLTTRVNGALTITGPLAAGAGQIAGTIDLDVTEISVAEGLGTTGALALEAVSHRNPPPGVLETLARARLDEPITQRPAGTPGITLDILVRAPNQIFVRGRGLDVELGGDLRVTGPVTDIQPVGEFGLIRGRLGILGQRLEFEEGSLQLVGNLDPIVFFVARTVTEEATAIVTVSGRVSQPEITLSSVPELPEDEVLALLIFNRSVQELTPFQIAQLAAAAAELAGAGGNGLLAQFRGAFGLDDLEIIAEDDGGAAVRAGRYIDDNIYLDVQTGTGGDTRVTINLDVTRNVTARGTVDTDGNSTIGIFYQRDY
jgi:translocation and assembly module TamB